MRFITNGGIMTILFNFSLENVSSSEATRSWSQLWITKSGQQKSKFKNWTSFHNLTTNKQSDFWKLECELIINQQEDRNCWVCEIKIKVLDKEALSYQMWLPLARRKINVCYNLFFMSSCLTSMLLLTTP